MGLAEEKEVWLCGQKKKKKPSHLTVSGVDMAAGFGSWKDIMTGSDSGLVMDVMISGDRLERISNFRDEN